MSRRKPSKAPQFNTFVWSLSNPSEALESNCQGDDSASRDFNQLQVPAKDSAIPETSAQYTALYPSTLPILHALSVFEKEWGEDSFSAYGFTLIMVTGKNAMGTSKDNQIPDPVLIAIANMLQHSLLRKHILVPFRLQKICLPSSLQTNLHFP